MPSRFDEFRIDEREQIRRVAADRDVGDENPQRHADLRCREADARRRIHRLDHVVDEPQDVGRDLGDGARGLVQNARRRSEGSDESRSASGRGARRERGARTCSAVAS